MLNRTVLVGRLTKDPELRSTPNGVNVGTFTLAVNRPFTNAQGERETDFINVVVFKKQAENVKNYLSKGSLAGVDGRLQTRSYDNKDGQRVFVTEVVADSVQFLEPKNNNQQQNNNYQQQNNAYNAPQNRQQSNNPFANANGPIEISSDDLPF
ncbi:TPA: single-stranded DNA-binding protein [Staphylococcus aureus]|uniref:single-stranded DNA-binding protein n=1 Tax=Staphylococcus aureus TaxID=1280 RepID=UPI0008A86DDE|nr:single-stranded DNA-binding protein [Staphylococcus aureus]EJX2076199.1 single-stranded DNA-binding protein [Staphylococcus aureus]MCC1360061.1 single-stranded DNA-binding protein [Staphylococcus aureus]OHS21017.1 single-stranded DNA-binding protein [Staphylococcus aureus]TLG73113.1 single-stranded DNA-binding protein [Staphylococcus aureus]TLW68644.1 single-stranded DNA-binding protein [Staphylococcus aureus]